MSKENDLDDLFKKRLQDPVDNERYHEADWDALEQMLDKRKKTRGIVYWLPLYGSVAALLLIFFGYLALRPRPVHQAGQVNAQVVNHPVVNHPKEHSGTNDGSRRQQNDQSQKAPVAVNMVKNLKEGKDGHHNKPFLSSSADGSRRTAGLQKPGTEAEMNNRSAEFLAAESTHYALGSERIEAEPVYAVTFPATKSNAGTANNKSKNIPVKTPGYRPQFALSVIAAPDVNGVGSFQQSKVGTNEGLLFSAGLSRKFTVSTGAIYSVKPYITGFENYHTGYQFPVNPINVTADCRMLDIPINIGYQVFNKRQNSISVGTGLSSYIMLHESFRFNYANTANTYYTTGPAQYTVPSPDGYYFGILNLNATFQHQLNPKVGFTVQPYMKIPLTTVGYSQVRLQTTGVALGLTWNLSTGSNQ